MENILIKQKFGFVQNFTPVWFATVLGFGGIALTSSLIAKVFGATWLNPVSIVLTYLDFGLFIFLFVTWLSKLIFYSPTILKELQHPVVAGFHSLMPAAMIMISIVFSRIGAMFPLWQHREIAISFWIAGAIFEILLLTITIYFLITNEKMSINAMNGGWLVPPVAALLTPVAGVKLTELISSEAISANILWVNYFFFGIGVFVFLLMAVALFSKVFFFEKLDPKILPSLWIMLVPFSLMSISLALFARETGTYLQSGLGSSLMDLVPLINPMLIGIGVWLLILLIALTIYYLRKLSLPYGAGWWAFIFPTGSVCLASLTQGSLTNQTFFSWTGLGIYIFLIALTLIVLYRTIKGLVQSISPHGNRAKHKASYTLYQKGEDNEPVMELPDVVLPQTP
ncbi:MAG: hypothetical protein U9R04_02230 [Chloroflexota bacterium]|nr:hypothetical protein [Chloroflexota bacterium]